MFFLRFFDYFQHFDFCFKLKLSWFTKDRGSATPSTGINQLYKCEKLNDYLKTIATFCFNGKCSLRNHLVQSGKHFFNQRFFGRFFCFLNGVVNTASSGMYFHIRCSCKLHSKFIWSVAIENWVSMSVNKTWYNCLSSAINNFVNKVRIYTFLYLSNFSIFQ